jgi:DNA-binding transcriptional ArsR family regulator
MKQTVLPVLAGRTRLMIATLLQQHETMTPKELADTLHCTVGHISNELVLLRAHGLVTARREGVHMLYCLSAGSEARLCEAVAEFERVDQHWERLREKHGTPDE